MGAAPPTLRARLRRFEPEAADFANRLIAAMDRSVIPGGLLDVRALWPCLGVLGATWIAFNDANAPILIAPRRCDGVPAQLTGATGAPDTLRCVAALGSIEPIIAAVEQALGVPLRPIGIVQRHATGAFFTLATTAADVDPLQIQEVWLAMPIMPEFLLAPLPPPISRWSTLPLPWQSRLPLNNLTMAHLSLLSSGALIPLGLGPQRGRLALPGSDGAVPALFDFNQRTARIFGTWRSEMANDLTDEGTNELAPPPPITGLKVSVSLSIDVGPLALGTVLGAGAGSVIALPLHSELLPVSVMIGDTCVARGELVALGDGFGVLISSRES